MKPFLASSGDMLADRRADYAEALHGSGAYANAAELMLGALEQAPQWAVGWFRLGEMQEAAGAVDQAARAWAMSLKLDPADRLGAALKLQLIGRGPATTTPPSAFIETLFDHYAETFDEALVEKLGYRVPALLEEAIRSAGPGHFGLAVDLGCGTGLMGEKLRPVVDCLVGYDISASMLGKARARGIYDVLVKADLQDFSHPGQAPDLVTAADVFIYVGALEGVTKTVAGMLADDGLFGFSVETLVAGGTHAGADFALRPSRRYAHSESYVLKVMAANGFSVRVLKTATIRNDRRKPVEGLIVVAGKAGG